MNARSAMLLVGLLVVPGVAPSAAPWSFHSTAELQAQHHSNLRLSSVDELDTGRSSVDVGLRVRRATETVTLGGEFHWINLRHTDAEFADSNDYRARLVWHRRWARFNLGLTGDAARENTLATEFDDTGIVDLGVQRDRRIFGGSATWHRTHTVAWGLSLTDERTGYDESPAYTDYRYSGIGLFRESALDERTMLVAGANYNEFDTEDGFTSSATTALTLGIEHNWSETLSIQASLGRSRTRTEDTFFSFFGPVRETSTDLGWTADFGIRQRWESTFLDLSVGQSIRPSGRGALTTLRHVDATLRHELSERSAMRLSGELRRFKRTSELTGPPNDREYGQITLAFDHWLSSRLRLTAEMTHRTQEFESRDDGARGNVASVSLRYDAGQP